MKFIDLKHVYWPVNYVKLEAVILARVTKCSRKLCMHTLFLTLIGKTNVSNKGQANHETEGSQLPTSNS